MQPLPLLFACFCMTTFYYIPKSIFISSSFQESKNIKLKIKSGEKQSSAFTPPFFCLFKIESTVTTRLSMIMLYINSRRIKNLSRGEVEMQNRKIHSLPSTLVYSSFLSYYTLASSLSSLRLVVIQDTYRNDGNKVFNRNIAVNVYRDIDSSIATSPVFVTRNTLHAGKALENGYLFLKKMLIKIEMTHSHPQDLYSLQPS